MKFKEWETQQRNAQQWLDMLLPQAVSEFSDARQHGVKLNQYLDDLFAGYNSTTDDFRNLTDEDKVWIHENLAKGLKKHFRIR